MGKQICANTRCSDSNVYEIGTHCITCGKEVRKLGMVEKSKISGAKTKLSEFDKKIKKDDSLILISNKMSDEEIFSEINKDMMNLAMHEAGSSWMRVGTLLSGNTTDMILGAGLKAMIDQNKIIIRQNELIRREVAKIIKNSTAI
jgi:hypothetical protein|tara:strand:+ start:89 stop:523 length:435 start_codon:yes stop_codon:yes gene_type:complete